MGAANFTTLGYGKSHGEAFNSAREQAAYLNGHGGYTGTIAEKPGSRLVQTEPLTLKQAQRLVRKLDEDYGEWPDDSDRPVYKTPEGKRWGEAYNDKWGPALAVEVKRSSLPAMERANLPRGQRAWLFFGWASS